MEPAPQVTLRPLTRELYHQYWKEFTSDPDIYMDMSRFAPYHYDAARVDAQYDAKYGSGSGMDFVIMLGDRVIGSIGFKRADPEKKECELYIHMQNDAVKNKGYGTRAEILALRYAFEVLGMRTVLADSVLKNVRSQHVLEKVGFVFVKEEGIFRYYRCDRDSWIYAGSGSEEMREIYAL